MTAITNTSSDPKMESVFTPSSSVQEAKSRFASALSSGVDTLVSLGHGRDRARKQVLSEIAGGCSADEEEVRRIVSILFLLLVSTANGLPVCLNSTASNQKTNHLMPLSNQVFKLMASQGVSMDDATKASTVSTAFRKALSSGTSDIQAIDELTSRLSLSKVAHHEPLRCTEAASSNDLINNTMDVVHSPAASASLTTRPSAQSLLTGGSGKARSPKPSGDKMHKGKKRVLVEKVKPNIEGAMAASKAEDEVNAKISKEEKSKDSGRKAGAPAERRGKRAASLRGVDEGGQPAKRVRSTSTV
jgi:hypothetical protein